MSSKHSQLASWEALNEAERIHREFIKATFPPKSFQDQLRRAEALEGLRKDVVALKSRMSKVSLKAIDVVNHLGMEINTSWRMSLDGIYTPELDDAVKSVKQGDSTKVNMLIEFLECDPRFFRSGYQKERILSALSRIPHSEGTKDRLRRVILHVVDSSDRREFRYYCHLARHVDSAEMRLALSDRLNSTDHAVARRARWVLTSLSSVERLGEKNDAL